MRFLFLYIFLFVFLVSVVTADTTYTSGLWNGDKTGTNISLGDFDDFVDVTDSYELIGYGGGDDIIAFWGNLDDVNWNKEFITMDSYNRIIILNDTLKSVLGYYAGVTSNKTWTIYDKYNNGRDFLMIYHDGVFSQLFWHDDSNRFQLDVVNKTIVGGGAVSKHEPMYCKSGYCYWTTINGDIIKFDLFANDYEKIGNSIASKEYNNGIFDAGVSLLADCNPSIDGDEFYFLYNNSNHANNMTTIGYVGVNDFDVIKYLYVDGIGVGELVPMVLSCVEFNGKKLVLTRGGADTNIPTGDIHIIEFTGESTYTFWHNDTIWRGGTGSTTLMRASEGLLYDYNADNDDELCWLFSSPSGSGNRVYMRCYDSLKSTVVNQNTSGKCYGVDSYVGDYNADGYDDILWGNCFIELQDTGSFALDTNTWEQSGHEQDSNWWQGIANYPVFIQYGNCIEFVTSSNAHIEMFNMGCNHYDTYYDSSNEWIDMDLSYNNTWCKSPDNNLYVPVNMKFDNGDDMETYYWSVCTNINQSGYVDWTKAPAKAGFLDLTSSDADLLAISYNVILNESCIITGEYWFGGLYSCSIGSVTPSIYDTLTQSEQSDNYFGIDMYEDYAYQIKPWVNGTYLTVKVKPNVLVDFESSWYSLLGNSAGTENLSIMFVSGDAVTDSIKMYVNSSFISFDYLNTSNSYQYLGSVGKDGTFIQLGLRSLNTTTWQLYFHQNSTHYSFNFPRRNSVDSINKIRFLSQLKPVQNLFGFPLEKKLSLVSYRFEGLIEDCAWNVEDYSTGFEQTNTITIDSTGQFVYNIWYSDYYHLIQRGETRSKSIMLYVYGTDNPICTEEGVREGGLFKWIINIPRQFFGAFITETNTLPFLEDIFWWLWIILLLFSLFILRNLTFGLLISNTIMFMYALLFGLGSGYLVGITVLLVLTLAPYFSKLVVD